jgi:hypothetical protein
MTQLGQALCDRFEAVSRSELVRLRRKMAALSDTERAVVEAITVEVTQGIALRLDAGLAALESAGVDDIVAQIFSVSRAASPTSEEAS